jgi:hypothetical protein
VGQAAFYDAEVMLLRMNLMKHDLSASWQQQQPISRTASLGPRMAGTTSSDALFDLQSRIPGVLGER